MKGFSNRLIATPHDTEAELWVVWEVFLFFLGPGYPPGSFVKVNVGALTNGASIPWLLTFIFPRWHPFWALAAALHDALVGEHNQPKALICIPGQEPREAKWEEAAAILKYAMQFGPQKTPRWIRSWFYHAVMLNKRVKRALGIWKRS